jgi:hypothetical protein
MDGDVGRTLMRACIAIFVVVGLIAVIVTGAWGRIASIIGSASFLVAGAYYLIYYPPIPSRKRR